MGPMADEIEKRQRNPKSRMRKAARSVDPKSSFAFTAATLSVKAKEPPTKRTRLKARHSRQLCAQALGTQPQPRRVKLGAVAKREQLRRARVARAVGSAAMGQRRLPQQETTATHCDVLCALSEAAAIVPCLVGAAWRGLPMDGAKGGIGLEEAASAARGGLCPTP